MAAKNKPVDEVTVADLGLSADSVGWAGSRQTITSVAPAPAREAGEKIEDDGEAYGTDRRSSSRSSRSSDPVRHRRFAGLSPTRGRVLRWDSQRCGCSPRPRVTSRPRARSRLLTKAREVADTVECVYVGRQRRRARGGARLSTARPRSTRSTPATGCPASSAPRRCSRWSRPTSPDLVLFAQTYDGRDAIARLSVKLDRPVHHQRHRALGRRRPRHRRHRDLRWQHPRRHHVRR